MRDLFEFWFGLFAGAVVAWVITFAVMTTAWRSEAVAEGKAEYYIDDGRTQWRWTLDIPVPDPDSMFPPALGRLSNKNTK